MLGGGGLRPILTAWDKKYLPTFFDVTIPCVVNSKINTVKFPVSDKVTGHEISGRSSQGTSAEVIRLTGRTVEWRNNTTRGLINV